MKHDMSQFNVPQSSQGPNPGAFYGLQSLKNQALWKLRLVPGFLFCQGSWSDGARRCKYAHLLGQIDASYAYQLGQLRYNFPEVYMDMDIEAYDAQPGNLKRFALQMLKAIPPGVDLEKAVNRLDREMERSKVEVPTVEMWADACQHTLHIQHSRMLRRQAGLVAA